MSTGKYDYYAVLGVSPSATDAEIRKAHRNVCLFLHPDRHVGSDIAPAVKKLLEARFLLITEAFDVLSDPVKRAAYDVTGSSSYCSSSATSGGSASSPSSTRAAQRFKELALIIPESEQHRYSPEQLRRLLKLADAEAGLLATAVRIGATSNLSLEVDSTAIPQTLAAASRHLAQTVACWAANDENMGWVIPGGGIKKQKPKKEEEEPKEEEKEEEREGEDEGAVVPGDNTPAVSDDFPSSRTLSNNGNNVDASPSPAPAPPVEPAKPTFVAVDPTTLMLQVNGVSKLVLIPADSEQKPLAELALRVEKEREAYKQQMEQFVREHPTEVMRLEKKLKMKQHQGQKQKSEEETAPPVEAEAVVYNRPPLPILLAYWLFSWLPAFHKVFRASVIPHSANGRYSFQMPIGSRTVSLVSVTGSRKAERSAMMMEIDAETRTGSGSGSSTNSSSLTWLWSVGLGTMGSKLQVGFKRALSVALTLKAKLVCWKETGPFFPQLYVALERKLTQLNALTVGWRIPGPWETGGTSRFGNLNVSLQRGPDSGFGLGLSAGSAIFSYAQQSSFCFFPVKKGSSSSNGSSDCDSISAIKFLRPFKQEREKSIMLVLNLAEPMLRHEDTFFFSRSWSNAAYEDSLQQRQEQQKRKMAKRGERDGVRGGGDNSNSTANGAAAASASAGHDQDDDCDEDDDDELFDGHRDGDHSGQQHGGESNSSCDFQQQQQQQQQQSGSSTNNKNNTSGNDDDENEGEKDKPLASPLLRHGFGVSLTVAFPILSALTGTWPAARFCNTTVSLCYMRGEHKITLPVRVSFSQSIFFGLVTASLPYLANRLWAAVPAISDAVDGERRRKVISQRVKVDEKVKLQRARAQLERDAMESMKKSKSWSSSLSSPASPSSSSSVAAAAAAASPRIVIVSATYGVLNPTLSWPPGVDLTADVTVAVQHLVALRAASSSAGGGSEFVINVEGKKSLLPGFFDPLPFTGGGLERKQLRVVYSVAGAKEDDDDECFELTVDDAAPLRIPNFAEHRRVQKATSQA